MATRLRDKTDGELLAHALENDDAFTELYTRYEAAVVTYLMRRTRDRELTADLTAETFATALLKADRFRDDGPAIGWLLGIARFAMLTSWKRGRAETRARQRLGIERIAFSDASLERVEALLDSQAPDNPVMVALDELPDSQREAVRAYVLDERTYEELANDLGIAEATVRQRVSRGLARLRMTVEHPRP